MRVLVIGGVGFIGSRLATVLRDRGHEVCTYDLAPGADQQGDVADTALLTLASEGHDVIVNLAAAHRDDVRPISLYDKVNVDGARSVAAAAAAQGIRRVVFTSSVAVYGLNNNDASEDTEPEPFNEYGRTKLEAERVYRQWQAGDRTRSVAIVRPSVVFGEGNRGNVYNLARQVHARRFLMVGRGDNRKSMSYVGNIVEYLADLVNVEAGVTLINYADKPDLSTREIIDVLRDAMDVRGAIGPRLPLWVGLAGGHFLDLIARLTRRTFPVSAIRVRKFVSETTINTDRLEASGYRPRYALSEAIRRTIDAEFPTTERRNGI